MKVDLKMKTSLIILLALYSITANAGPRHYQCSAIGNGKFCGQFNFKMPRYTENDEKALAVAEDALSACPGASFNLYKTIEKEVVVYAAIGSQHSELTFGQNQFPSQFEISTGSTGSALRVNCKSFR